MKTLVKVLVLLLIPLIIVGCKDDDSDPTPETTNFATLQSYMLANDMDLPNVLDGWITAAPAEQDMAAFVENHYILDLRSSADYNDAHIAGAVNTTLASVVATAATSNGKPIVVVCYTGQTAGHAVVALRLSGYPDAKVLKFGMSGWHSGTDSWSSKTGDLAVGHQNWVGSATQSSVTYNPPELTTIATDGAGILAERVSLLLTGGFNGVNNSDVMQAPTNYMINNFWDEGDVTKYGCIDGALRIKPLTLTNGEIFNLDPSKTIVTYCWTGQTSSMVTAYLKVLGYDTKSLKFGVNGMIYSNLESHKFSVPAFDLPVVAD